ncbi:hypothetical protein CI610_03500 [invertebrate metagenome]|uniref:Uncharacterized protein n=1 Tax=invertebrate metagenome TaxID=1711999 RepID=A0A2H9T2X2_9ZZZZ
MPPTCSKSLNNPDEPRAGLAEVSLSLIRVSSSTSLILIWDWLTDALNSAKLMGATAINPANIQKRYNLLCCIIAFFIDEMNLK